MYYVYFIRNKKENKSYIGYTKDLKRRLSEHQDKIRARILRARPSTKAHKMTYMLGALEPDLIYYEAYKSKKDAYNREQKLKQRGQSIRWLKERIKNSL